MSTAWRWIIIVVSNYCQLTGLNPSRGAVSLPKPTPYRYSVEALSAAARFQNGGGVWGHFDIFWHRSLNEQKKLVLVWNALKSAVCYILIVPRTSPTPTTHRFLIEPDDRSRSEQGTGPPSCPPPQWLYANV